MIKPRMPPKMASSRIITTAAMATVTSTTMVLVLTSALDGHTTFFSSLFVSRKNFATRLQKPFTAAFILATKPGFGWMQKLGPNMVSIFIIFALLYWVGMARIVRSQVLTLKESEYVTAARALGASGGRIIKKHLLTNCMGTLIVTTTLQIPSSIFTESYLSFLGLGVAAPMPSLGSLATDAVKGMNTYPVLLIAPALMISIMILVFNLFGDGLRDAFDPKLKS